MTKTLKKNKYNYKKSIQQIVMEYLRTVVCSFLVAVVITSLLAFNARNEMIKNLYQNTSKTIEKKVAQQLIEESDYMENIEQQRYSVCMSIGEIYVAAGLFNKAEIAYKVAISKTKVNNYKPRFSLIYVLAEQEKFDEAISIINSIKDINSKALLKFKTKAYIALGDKYYSVSKFLSAAKCYEKAEFYYSKFTKKDKVVSESIKQRTLSSYIQVADLMVRSNRNSDAAEFLRHALTFAPDDNKLQYKLAIVLSDLDPEESVKYFDKLLDKIPQEIDYNILGRTLMKAANIADISGNSINGKYYRYKIRSIDYFVERKVVYRDDINVSIEKYDMNKFLFRYPIKLNLKFYNTSKANMKNLKADFILVHKNKKVEKITKTIADVDHILFVSGAPSEEIELKFRHKILTRKDFSNYKIDIILYKDEKYKTYFATIDLPNKNNSDDIFNAITQ